MSEGNIVLEITANAVTQGKNGITLPKNGKTCLFSQIIFLILKRKNNYQNLNVNFVMSSNSM